MKVYFQSHLLFLKDSKFSFLCPSDSNLLFLCRALQTSLFSTCSCGLGSNIRSSDYSKLIFWDHFCGFFTSFLGFNSRLWWNYCSVNGMKLWFIISLPHARITPCSLYCSSFINSLIWMGTRCEVISSSFHFVLIYYVLLVCTLLQVDPHCSYKISASVSVTAAAGRFLLMYCSQVIIYFDHLISIF